MTKQSKVIDTGFDWQYPYDRCKKCKKDFNLDEMHLKGICKICFSKKVCKKCKTNLYGFSPKKKSLDKLHIYCKRCRREMI